jgi:RHS repeat-associated protein
LSACARDALGRIATQTETLGGATVEKAYAYDLRGRLVSVTTNGALAESYAYDLNGNRTNSWVAADLRAAEYDAQDRLLSSGGATFACDANGSLTNKTADGQTTAYSYDLFGRLESVTLPDGRIVSYDRDALHRVTAKRVNGAVTQGWIYKDGLAPIAETDGGTNIVSLFVYGTSAFSPDYMVRDGATYRLIRDFAGSVRLVVNADTGAIAQRLDYDSFGNILTDTNPGFQPFGFKAGLYDPDTGLVHFGARWYDPVTGRWISKDPILLAGGLNLYVFCGNDPVNFSDPWGLCEKTGREKFQTALDAIGVFDPTGIADGLNALIYLWNGEYGYAGISAFGMVAYFGDTAKAGKYVDKALKASNMLANKQVNAVAQEFGITGVARKEFGDFIEATKRGEGRGGADNYTYQELKQLAQEFLNQ